MDNAKVLRMPGEERRLYNLEALSRLSGTGSVVQVESALKDLAKPPNAGRKKRDWSVPGAPGGVPGSMQYS